MNIENIVIVVVLIFVLILSVGYIIKAKKSGAKCIGCPSSHECGKCNCGCGEQEE